jgi:CubicO group peptidase (beta-lactamase class C family)
LYATQIIAQNFTLADAHERDITLRHLVSHRSGLPDIMDWNAIFAKPAEYDDGVLERYVRSLSSLERLSAPGERWSYSGIGYNVLGDVVAKVSGQTLESYLQRHILKPLHMDDTILIIKEDDKKRLASPHMRNEHGVVFVNDGFLFPYRRELAPGGPLYSSITDMTRFAALHLNRGELAGTRILPAASYDEMWTPMSTVEWDFGPSTKSLFVDYGLGFFIGNIDGRRVVHHIGLDFGYSAAMLLAPDDGIAVVTISNYFDWKKWDLFAVESAIEVMRLLYV